MAVRIEKLELNKIRVTVYPVDLTDMNINIKTLRPDSPQLHTFLFKVMERVKRETGFNPYSGQIVVEASPAGDCMELTVTKLCKNNAHEVEAKKVKRIKAVLKKPQNKNTVYSFASFEDLCDAIVNLHPEVLKNSSCYEIEGNYVLSLSNVSQREHLLLKEFVCDFDNTSLSKKFLEEHATLIAENESLLSMAEGICALRGRELNN